MEGEEVRRLSQKSEKSKKRRAQVQVVHVRVCVSRYFSRKSHGIFNISCVVSLHDLLESYMRPFHTRAQYCNVEVCLFVGPCVGLFTV